MSVMFALFCDKQYMDIETEPTREQAIAFINGCYHGARFGDREVTGYVLPDGEEAMRKFELPEEADRAMADFRGQRR